jgi:molybdopterin-guanine dinucleotide biosynthesis protein A
MFSLVVQAGGGSTRMGEDKGLKPFLGRPLIQRVIERLAPLADEIIITANRLEEYALPGVRVVPDLLPGRGSLGGLYTALASAAFPIVGVVACDMPFASLELLEMECRILTTEAVDVVIPRTMDGYEPFHAVYRRESCLPAIRSALDANQWKVVAWFPQVRVRELTPAEQLSGNSNGRAFWNVNTPQEFARAEELARDEQEKS